MSSFCEDSSLDSDVFRSTSRFGRPPPLSCNCWAVAGLSINPRLDSQPRAKKKTARTTVNAIQDRTPRACMVKARVRLGSQDFFAEIVIFVWVWVLIFVRPSVRKMVLVYFGPSLALEEGTPPWTIRLWQMSGIWLRLPYFGSLFPIPSSEMLPILLVVVLRLPFCSPSSDSAATRQLAGERLSVLAFGPRLLGRKCLVLRGCGQDPDCSTDLIKDPGALRNPCDPAHTYSCSSLGHGENSSLAGQQHALREPTTETKNSWLFQ